MPNGGSDNCGSCRFHHRRRCQIRDVVIENPRWTYCANVWARDSIPIGPITRLSGHGAAAGGPQFGWKNLPMQFEGIMPVDPLGHPYEREIWIDSPDTEEIRQHLLDILDKSRNSDLIAIAMWQLGEFREKRAEDRIGWISENGPERLRKGTRSALERIQSSD